MACQDAPAAALRGDARANRRRMPVVALVLIIALGLFVRTWRLGTWPPLYGDEAIFGVLASRVLEDGALPLDGARIYQSPLFPMMQTPSVALLGKTAFALRVLPLLAGLVGILAVYLTARRMVPQAASQVALAAAAVLPLGVVFGRIGWEVTVSVATLALANYLGLRAWREHSVGLAGAAAFLLSLSTYIYPATTLAIPALAVAVALSGHLRQHLREAVVVLLLVALLSYPSTRLLGDLIANGERVGIATAWAREARSDSPDRWSTPFSLSLTAENFARTLDQWTGAITVETVLGPPRDPWTMAVKLLRGACVLLWLLILPAAGRCGAKGRFMVTYVLTVFALAHLANPAFLNLPAKGRYLVAMLPVVPLLVALVFSRGGDRWGRVARGGVWVMFAVWAGVTAVMLSFIARDLTGNIQMMSTEVGDPNKAAAEFLLERVDPENDLVLCRSWWTYWPIAYYTSERLPMFTSDLVHAENEPVVLPDPGRQRRVWWVQLPYADSPPFTADLVVRWPDRADRSRHYTIWLADDPALATEWAVDHYQRRLAEKQRQLGVSD